MMFVGEKVGEEKAIGQQLEEGRKEDEEVLKVKIVDGRSELMRDKRSCLKRLQLPFIYSLARSPLHRMYNNITLHVMVW